MKLQIISVILGDCNYYGEQYKQFNQILMREASSVCEHCVRSICYDNQFDCKRLNLICTDNPKKESIKFNGVLSIDVPFSHKYFEYSVAEKEKYLFTLVKNALYQVFVERHWNISLLLCLDEYEKNRFISEFITQLKCKHKAYQAIVCCEQSLQQAKFYLQIYEKNVLLKQVDLFACAPNVMDYNRYLGKLQWNKEDTIILYGKNGEIQCTTNLGTVL